MRPVLRHQCASFLQGWGVMVARASSDRIAVVLAFVTMWPATALLAGATSADALLKELERAIGRDDRQAVVALVQYPMTVDVAAVRIPIRDATALLQTFDAVFTPELKDAIRDRSAIRDGLIEVASAQGLVKITGISVPNPSRAAGGATLRGPTPRGPRRVVFTTVEVAQLSGSLPPGRSDAFVVRVEKGRVLEARIDGISGRDIVLKVAEAITRTPLDGKAAAGARLWVGRVPETADYRIEVTRLAKHGGELLPYILVVRRR